MRSAHHLHETSTRYVGWCPICERDIKVRTGLVHHGYERPGVGFIIGDCPGVGNPPYETSTHACDFYLRVFAIPKIREAENVLAILNSPEGPPYLTFEKYDIAARRVARDPRSREIEMINLSRDQAEELEAQLPGYDKGRYSWERRLRAAISNTESKLKHWEREKGRMERLIADWQPQPLRTVEQEIQHQEQTRAERETAKTAARDQKIATEVAKLQKRIDSAVKNKNSAVLADIYGSQKLREISGYRITQDQAVQMLDRDNVWQAFGLLTPEDGFLIETRAADREQQSRAATRILETMKYGRMVPRADRGFDRFELEWPAALGGGIAKTRGF